MSSVAAIIWARRMAELAPHDEAIARTLVSLLDRVGTAYERFVEMWRGCDPALRGLVQQVERRLALLKRAWA